MRMLISEDIDEALRQVGTELLQRLDELVEAANARISAELPSYHSLVPPDDLRTSGRNIIGAVLQGMAGTALIDRDEVVRSAAERGRVRQTQGVALEDVLRAIRFDFAALWEPIVSSSAHLALQRDVASYAMLRIWEELEGIMIAFSEGYRYQESLVDRETTARRSRLLTSLIYESRDDSVWFEQIRDVLGFAPDDRLLVCSATLGERQESHLEMRWRQGGLSNAHTLQVGGHVVGIAPWTDRNVQVLDEMITGYEDRAAVIAPMVIGVKDAHDAIGMTRSVVTSAPSGVVTEVRHLLIDSLVVAQPAIAGPLSRVLLSGLLELPVGERERLMETFEGWMTVQGTTADVARHLFRHRNTVINHLRRIEELTGLSPNRPVEAATLVAAFKASRAWWPTPQH